MLLNFFNALRAAGVPASLREHMDLLGALSKRVAFVDQQEFYLLARCILVKDERFLDRFDVAYQAFFRGLDKLDIDAAIPDEWLKNDMLRDLTEEQRRAVEAMGGWEKLMEAFRERLAEQQEKHQGGNKWIGTGGTSPFGHSGFNPEGIRIGGESRARRAVKVWEKRQYRNLAGNVQLGTRNIKLALRRLRKFARQGACDELDLKGTISATAANGGLLDIKMVPERHNAIKVVIFFDVGGSMDPHIKVCEELFSAVRTEFKHLEYYYFHNFIYDSVWRDNQLRYNENIPIIDILRSFDRNYRMILVGDAAMSPYEIVQPGGAIDQWNDTPGEIQLRSLTDHFAKAAWINPLPSDQWSSTQSIGMVKTLMDDRMYPMSLDGLDQCVEELR